MVWTAAAAVQDSDARSTRPAYAAEVGPSFERPGDPRCAGSGLLNQIQEAVRRRGGLRADSRGNVRLRCPWCEHHDKRLSWNPTHRGGSFQCFNARCGEHGGLVKFAEKLADAGEIVFSRTDHRQTSIVREWQNIALTGLDWRALARRFSDAKTPTAIARAATRAAQTYICLTGIAAKAGTVTPAASTRTLSEMTGTSRHAVTLALIVLRRAGLVRLTKHWQTRTLKEKARCAPEYLIRDPRSVNLLAAFLCGLEPEGSYGTPLPENITGSITHNSVAWRRGGISHANFAVLAHLERGPATQKSLGAATGFSQTTISRSLHKLLNLDLVRRDHRRWQRTSRTLAEVVSGHQFDQARAAAARQRLRHQMERQRFDQCDLDRVLVGATKTRLILRDGISAHEKSDRGEIVSDRTRTHKTGQTTHREPLGATITITGDLRHGLTQAEGKQR